MWRALLVCLAIVGLSACATTSPDEDASAIDAPPVEMRKGVAITLHYPVPDPVLDLVADVAVLAGEPSLTITSGARTPRKQVEVMIDYYLECEPHPTLPDCSVAYLLQTYEPECLGNLVEIYEAAAPLSALSPERRETAVAAMANEVEIAISALDADPTVERQCMSHVSMNGQFAIDLDPGAMESPFAVYHAVRAMGDRLKQSRFYYPPIEGVPESPAPDAAFHLEVFTQ
jgi:hypothetical protein